VRLARGQRSPREEPLQGRDRPGSVATSALVAVHRDRPARVPVPVRVAQLGRWAAHGVHQGDAAVSGRMAAAALPLVAVATRTKRELFGEVEVRSAVVQRGEWSPEQPIGLLGQGYSVDRVAALTGYDRRWLAAQDRREPGPWSRLVSADKSQ